MELIKFKQTDVGLIPKDWKIDSIIKVSKHIFLGLTAKVDYVDFGGYPLVRVTDITKGKLDFTNVRTISEEQHKKITRNKISKKGDVLVSKSGSLGVCAIVDSEKEFSTYESIITISPKEILDSSFLLWLMRDERTQERMIGGKVGSSVSHLNIKMFRELRVPLPSLIEQKSISQTLTNTDNLIQAIEKKLTKKRAIKQGAMQKLLTPKEDWEVKKLGELAEFYKGKGLPKNDITEQGKYKCIHYGELFTKYKEQIREIISRTNNTENCFYSKNNDVLMPTSDVTPNGLATASCLNESNVILGGDVLVIRISEAIINGTFLSYFISQNRKQVMQLVTGSTVYHLYGSDMSNFVLNYPELNIQTQIATILSDMDAEIEQLEQKLSKYKMVKQGLMQNLLTGKIRLV